MRTFIVALAALLLTLPGTGRAETLYFIHVDHLGTPRLAIGEDGVERWRWDNLEPFGDNAPIETMGTEGYLINLPLRFPGQYADKETNLHYNYFRDYDPGIGRYPQSDPIGLRGGLNTYSYVRSTPLSAYDPFGLVPNPAEAACLLGPNPVCVGGVAADVLTTIIGGAAIATILSVPGDTSDSAAPSGTSTGTGSQSCPPDDPCKGLRDQLRKHQKKLDDYIKDPRSFDSRGFLGQGRDEAVIAGRIRSLQKQIENFKKLLEECERRNGK